MTDERTGEIATPEFHAWCKEHLVKWKRISEQVISKGEQHIPMLLVYPVNPVHGMKLIAIADFSTVEDKVRVANAHRGLASHTDIVYAVVLITEAWTRVATPDEAKKYTNLEDAPDRREAMLFSAIRGRQQLYTTCPIIRPGNTLGEPMTVDPMTSPHMEGRMVLNVPPQVKH